jgi:phosphatidylglycerophosphate synthase
MNKIYPNFLTILALIVIIAVLFFIIQPSIYDDPLWLIPITNTLLIAVIVIFFSGEPSRIPPAFNKEELL